MKPHRKKINISIGNPIECPACHYKRTTIGGVYVKHMLRSSLRVDKLGRTVGQPCPYSGQKAVK